MHANNPRLERHRAQCRVNQRKYRKRLKEKKRQELADIDRQRIEKGLAPLHAPETEEQKALNAQLKIEKHRETCRRNQRNYRNRLKELHQANQALEDHCNRLSLYKATLNHGRLLTHGNRIQFHGLITALYFDYFQFGIGSNQRESRHQAQESFVYFNFDEKVVFESPNNYTGPAFFLKQMEMYTSLFQLQLGKAEISKLDRDGTMFQFITTATFTIRHQTILILYPHMLSDIEFMQEVIGKQLVVEVRQVFHFNENHKVDCFRANLDLMSGWFQLLKDPIMVAKVLRLQKLNGIYINEDACVTQTRSKYLAIESILN